MTTIKDLKKNDRFKFNDEIYLVRRKYISDEKPLIAWSENKHNEEHRFYNEDLDIEKS